MNLIIRRCLNTVRALWQGSANIDQMIGQHTRTLASQTSRRSMLSKVGMALVGVGALPMLPVFREARAAADLNELGNPESCDYWRYCAFSGYLCSCCGGSYNQCPPGSETASVSWVGTCHNPTDGKDYLISYNDCCGKSACGRCGCHRSEGDKPVYTPSKSNSILWCFGSNSHAYHCTLALVLGEAS